MTPKSVACAGEIAFVVCKINFSFPQKNTKKSAWAKKSQQTFGTHKLNIKQ
jgi:hypothetical protein